jgi:hypothetical protein
VAVALGIGVALAALIFVQTFPSTPSGALTIRTTCVSTTLADNLTGTVPVAYSAGSVLYTCPTGAPPQTPAFNSTGTAPSTPTFTLPTDMTSLAYTPFPADNCYVGAVAITSGTPIVVPAGQYNYCGFYSSYPADGFASFTVSWS